jgi:hypothetical protein
MEVSDKLHAPAALSPGKQPPVFIVYEAQWGSRARLDVTKKIKICCAYWKLNPNFSVVQPIT